MGSRENQPTPHLSSLVVRPTDSDGANGGSDYEPGEVRPDPPSFSRSDRFTDSHGYRMHHAGSVSPPHHRTHHAGSISPLRHRMHHAGSVSPLRHRNADGRYSPDLDHSGVPPPRSRGFGSGRDPGRPHRHYSPPNGRGREAGRFVGRSYDGPGYGAGQVRGEGPARSNPLHVRPRDGDWMCPDPLCNNLNFARREFCNKCKNHRYAPTRRGGHHGPPLHPPRHMPGPPINRSPPGRFGNGYRSPPRALARDDPRDFRAGLPHSRLGGRFPDVPIRRERPYFADAAYRNRGRFERPLPLDWGHRDRGRESFLNERKGFERRATSPPHLPVLPARGYVREGSHSPVRGGPPPPLKDYLGGRSRSPMRGGAPPLKDYRERSRSPVRGGPPGLPPLKDYLRGGRSRSPVRGGPPGPPPLKDYLRGGRSRSPVRGGPPGPPPLKDYHRERSRSPVRGGPPPPPHKDYRRDLYLERGRDDRRVGRDAY